MCQKTSITKRFFVLVNIPIQTQKPLVMGVLRNQFMTDVLWKQKRDGMLKETEVEALGYTPSVGMRAHLVPIEIPRDWFLH